MPGMKETRILMVSSVLSILLLTIHVTDDVARGFDKWRPSSPTFCVLILPILLYGALVLTERRSGLILMLITGLGSVGMPIIHRSAGTVARNGGFFFLWTLMALGATGGLSIILVARALWNRRRGKIMTAVAHENSDRRG